MDATDTGSSTSSGDATGSGSTSDTESSTTAMPDLPEPDCPHLELQASANTDLDMLAGVECFTGFVDIDTSKVDDLSPLASLKEGGSIFMSQSGDAAILSDLTDLGNIEALEGLVVTAALESLEGFDALWHVGTIDLTPSTGTGVGSIVGLESLRVVDGVFSLGRAEGEPTPGPSAVDSLLPLSELETCGRLDVVDLDELQDLDGLESLVELEFVGLVGNATLVDIAGLGSVESLTKGIDIHENPQLPTCQAVEFADNFPNLLPQQIDIYANLQDACGG